MDSKWSYEEYLNEQTEEIKKLQVAGYTARQILDKNEFCYEALKTCGLPISYLIPKVESSIMNLQEWDTHTSSEHKWEFDGTPFCSEMERDRVLIGLLYSAGLKHVIEILPMESREELLKLVRNLK